MVATIKAQKPLTIIRREVENDTINYGILSGEKVYIATLKNGVPCNCKTENGSACSSYYFSPASNKGCKHCTLALSTESTRGTDLQQHIADDVHTCCICSNRVSKPGYCFGCLA